MIFFLHACLCTTCLVSKEVRRWVGSLGAEFTRDCELSCKRLTVLELHMSPKKKKKRGNGEAGPVISAILEAEAEILQL